MKVLIIGFDSYAEVDDVMQKLIEDSGCYLFYIVCGGLGNIKNKVSIGEEWAIRNGAPIYNVRRESMDELMKALEKEVDYVVMKISDGTPQVWKNFLMRMKAAGKHGTVVRG